MKYYVQIKNAKQVIAEHTINAPSEAKAIEWGKIQAQRTQGLKAASCKISASLVK